MSETRIMVNAPTKNVAVSVLLTIFFGGFGLLYSTVKGGIIMSIIEFINFWLCFLIIGLFLAPVIHLICVIWGVTAVNKYNRELLDSLR
ncbi:MAG: hypothetical protein A2X61_10905 [Ignavibacteria bacterium GWB2_35_12]|nr:MAG: hypothetical protein A2X63_05120 [Ignavibacteria bacterium GWA2_35_8]OGU40319.1 MAG: hypothetical protein A2X61_10905 [Ignavibacteria bacterium GWB2_35_12]OGU93055.1 MAG: hypothetical protein A2220_16025 [Ignavibacteria bacterium RIFOXYA2_FULL_35_10]OGV24747.1 MAG: hypothetical protein A2475_14130 [Ignavibacteria bacterium RIFOXYC2_FULL_35_21]